MSLSEYIGCTVEESRREFKDDVVIRLQLLLSGKAEEPATKQWLQTYCTRLLAINLVEEKKDRMTEPTCMLSIQDLRIMMQLLEVIIQNFEQKLKVDEDHIAVLEYQKSKQEQAKSEATQRLKAKLANSKSAESAFLPHEDIQLYDTYSRIKRVVAVLVHPEWQPTDPQATHLLLVKRAMPELRFESIEKSALKHLSEDIRRINFTGSSVGSKRVLSPL